MTLHRERRRAIATGASVAAHVAMFVFLLSPERVPPPAPPPPEPMVVQLVAPKPPTPPGPEPTPNPTPAKSKPDKPKEKTKPTPARQDIQRPTPAPPKEVVARVVSKGAGKAVADPSEVGDAELGSAAVAGAGPAGGSCDMARWLQNALQKDARVRAAVAQAQDRRAIRMWNGAWVRHPGQDGAGLAAVREVMTWEIAFAPKACRTQPVRGLVLFNVGEGSSAARIVVGQGEWRWADLLFAQKGAAGGDG